MLKTAAKPAIIALAVAAIALTGCMGQWIKTDVPKRVQELTGAPAQVPLDRAEAVMREYQEAVAEQARRAQIEEQEAKAADERRLAALRRRIEDDAASRQLADVAAHRAAARELADATDQAVARSTAADRMLEQLIAANSATVGGFQQHIAAGRERAASMTAGLYSAIDIGKQAAGAAGVPAPILALGTYLLGLFMPRPKESTLIESARKEGQAKVDAMIVKADGDYDAGRNDAINLLAMRASLSPAADATHPAAP
ncbi:MAG: hypothetical protein IT469_01660 [Pseudomonadales bacterium]|nr:hypothetical protein [Pseudomonadales bacterium]